MPKPYLPRVIHSPLRLPLTKYLNYYPSESIDYFINKIHDKSTRQLFWSIMRTEEAGQLREQLKSSVEKFVQATFKTTNTNNNLRAELQLQGILMVRVLLKYEKDLFDKVPLLYKTLVDLWESPEFQQRIPLESSLTPFQAKEAKLVILCFLDYCKLHPEKLDTFYLMLGILTHRSLTDYTFLESFYQTYVPENFSHELKENIINDFFEYFKNQVQSNHFNMATISLKMILIPFIQHCIQSEKDREVLFSKNVIQKLLGSESSDGILPTKAEMIYPDTALNIELLRVCTLLIKNFHDSLSETRKQLIKFAWLHLRNEDAITSQSAYYCVCCFIKWFETPPKIIFQVFCQLLKAYHGETRGLVRESLNVLVPVLNEKLANQVPNTSCPMWINCTRKIMTEEIHIMPQVIQILQLISRHADLFYPYRHQFVNPMITALPRICWMQNASTENKQLSLSLVGIIIDWEKKRRIETGELNGEPKDDPSQEQTWTPKIQRIEAMANFLIKMIVANFKPSENNAGSNASNTNNSGSNPGGQPEPEQNLSSETEALFKELLSVWPQTTVRLDYFEKILVSEENVKHVAIGLRILLLICEHQMSTFVPKHAQSLAKDFQAPLSSEDGEISNLVSELVSKIFKHFKQTDVGASDIFKQVIEVINKNLSSEKVPSRTLNILTTLSNAKQDFVLEFHQSLVKLIERLVIEQLPDESGKMAQLQNQAAQNAPGQPAGGANATPQKKSPKDTMLWDAIKLFSDNIIRMPQATVTRFLKVILLLLERSNDEDLLINIFKNIQNWKDLMDPALGTEFLIKLKRFSKVRSAELHASFLSLIYTIYRHPSTTQEEKIQHLKGTVLLGLSSRNSELRKHFFECINKEIERDLDQRMRIILSARTWDSIGQISYWIQQALDLLLGISNPTQSFKLGSTSALFPALATSDFKSKKRTTPQSLKDILEKHESFLDEIRGMKVQSIIEPLQALLHEDSSFAHRLWISIFPMIWKSLKQTTRTELTQSLPTLLFCTSFLKQNRVFPNAIQSLMYGFHKCQPPIEIQPTVVNYCVKNFNCWHLGIRMLEEQMAVQPNETTFQNLNHLYRSLSEEDFYFGMCYQESVVEDSHTAIVYEQLGMWQKAQQVLVTVLRDHDQGYLPNVSLLEQDMWRLHWEDCCRKLNQWDLLIEFARVNKRMELLVQNSWQIGEWETMREAFQLMNIPPEYPQMKILQSYLSLHDNKIGEADHLCKQAMNILVQNWIGLPSIPSICHVPMLQSFQKIIEVYESVKIVKDLATKQNKISDIRHTLLTWRQRLPNEWDDISHWNDLLQWRQHIFGIITEELKNDKDSVNIGPSEMSWSINKFSQIASYQGLVELCLEYLKKTNDLPSVLASDAFIHRKEQIKCYMKLPKFYHVGVDIINATNLEPFGVQQKAEFYQLRGELLMKMGYNEEADKSFSIAVSHYPQIDRCWISWAKYWDSQFQQVGTSTTEERANFALIAVNCYLQGVKCNLYYSSRGALARVLWLISHANNAADVELFDEINKISIKKRSGGSLWVPKPKKTKSSTEPSDTTTNDTTTAVAVADDSNQNQTDENKSEDKDDKDKKEDQMDVDNTTPSEKITPTDTILSVFAKHVENIPEWLWITWISELLNGLYKPQSAEYTILLNRIATKYPQALYYELNSFIQQESVRSNSSDDENDMEVVSKAVTQAKAVMSVLSNAHTGLFNSMSYLTEQIDKCLQPTPEEDMYTLVSDILLRAYISTNDDRQSLVKYLELMHHLLFVRSNDGQEVDQTSKFVQNYEELFKSLIPSSENSEFNITELIASLETLKDKLKTKIQKMKPKLFMDKLSPSSLASFQSDSVQIPGQFVGTMEPNPDDHIIIDKFDYEVKVMKNTSVPKRMIAFRGNNGENTYFLVESSHRIPTNTHARAREIIPGKQKSFDYSWESEARFSKLLRYFNNMLKKTNMQARKRHITIPVTTYTSISPNMRLIGSNESVVPHEAIYEYWCQKNGQDFYQPIIYYRKNVMEGNSDRTTVYNHITESVIPKNVYQEYVYSKLNDDYEAAWHLRKNFTTQLSACSLISYLFSTEKRNMFNLFLTPNNSQIFNRKFFPLYNTKGKLLSPMYISSNDSDNHSYDNKKKNSSSRNGESVVPYLFTNNLINFVGSPAITGVFSTVMLASVLTLGDAEILEQLKDRFRLYFQDDLYKWSEINNKQLSTKDIIYLTEENTSSVSKKITQLAPRIRADEVVDSSYPINSCVMELLKSATDPNNLSQVNPCTFPWF
eukprot:TRINITY_DN7318_c0_g3_i1.p1 TRINITY_DN7318_c0_g3~~TRINITY_DN7318_c0_g3_i1.p1  ORF type:complete len:2261 (-),score=569.45 TRINITY_DN7318_c0_g3_i1:97-6879(-)